MDVQQLGCARGLLTHEGPASEGTQDARNLDLALGQSPGIGHRMSLEGDARSIQGQPSGKRKVCGFRRALRCTVATSATRL
jgi:hypothetical protein